MLLMYCIVGLLIGVVFGVALEKGRVFEPGMIVGQFQLRNWTMVKMFLSAIATSLIVIGLMYTVGWIGLSPKAAVFPATILGGLIFGVGMAMCGACPGTVLAQIGAGYKDGWVILAGGLCGALAFGYLEPTMAAIGGSFGKITLADATGVPFIVLAVIVAAVLVAILVVLEKWRPWKSDLGQDYDGSFIPPDEVPETVDAGARVAND